MSCGFSRWFLTLALGAGVWGWRIQPALAGDKIEFSSASETLALPTVERTESGSVEVFHMGNGRAVQNMTPAYSMLPPPDPPPARRQDDRNARSGLFSSETDRGGLDHSFANPSWAYEANASYNSASNRSDDLSPWLPSENPSTLGRGQDDMNPRSGTAEARSESLNSLTRPGGPGGLGNRNMAERDWAYRAEDAYALNATAPVAEQLKPQKKETATFGSTLSELFSASSVPGSSGYNIAPSISSSMTPSLMPSSQLGSRPDAPGPGYNGNGLFSGHTSSFASGKMTGNSETGLAGGVPAVRSWEGLSGFGAQAPAPPPPRKPLNQSATGPGHPQQGGAFLPWINKPGGIPGAPGNR